MNVYAFAGMPSAPELEALGVARVSVGCGPMQARSASRAASPGAPRPRHVGPMSDGALSVRDVNALMSVDPGSG